MIVYRLAKAKHSEVLSGKGAELTGGRWNSKGIQMIYTSESRALCTAEIAIHMPLGILPSDYKIITIDIPETIKIIELTNTKLPSDWKSVPHPGSTQKIGDDFILKNEGAVLKVPSVVVPGDFNYLLNPFYNEFQQISIIKIESFEFDKRLFAK